MGVKNGVPPVLINYLQILIISLIFLGVLACK